MLTRIFVLCLCCTTLLVFNCKPRTTDGDTAAYSVDTASIIKGQMLFAQQCSACHNFRQDAIGPRLGGITEAQSREWITSFVKEPQANRWNGKDAHVKELFEKYSTAMPSFPELTENDFNNLLAYLHTKPKSTFTEEPEGPAPLKEPVLPGVIHSAIKVEIEPFITIPPSSERKPLARITQFVPEPGSTDVFILDLRGKLFRVHDRKQVVYMDVAKLRPAFISQPGLATGFGSVAFHPDFKSNGLFYTSHTEGPRRPGDRIRPDFDFDDSLKSAVQYVITEWKAQHPDNVMFEGESRELFRISMVAGIHGVQEIAFNPTAKKGTTDYAMLYICVGDGGAVENGYAYLTHDITKAWGTILRIDPKGKNASNKNYGIPETNPFYESKNPKVVREIYAYGFRNPHRISWTKDGKMLAVNVGNSHIEAIDLVEPGADFGWPIREGTFEVHPDKNLSNIYPLSPDDSKSGITYPVGQYDHAEGRAITGGFEYTGTQIPALKGKYIFGDILIGKLFYVELADLKKGKQAPVYEWQITINGEIKTLKDFTGPERVDLHFGRDNSGELYLMTKADGKVYKLVPGR